jgi:hypothetical protein
MIMKKLLLSLMAVATLGVVQAKKVKFQVDMTGQTISANGVHVAGNFQAAAGAPGDWSPGATALTNGGSGNIYSVVVDIPAGKYYEFKFINDNNWGAGEEQIPAISKVESAANGGSNGNRWIYIDSLANDTTVLPAIMFGGSAPAGKVAVRFAVDLQTQASVNPNGVYIAGNFQGANGASGDWKPNETRMSALFPMSATNGKVFEYIAYIDTNSTIEFKYLNGNDWPFNESVPSACQVGGGNQNRTYTAGNTSMALAKVCFGACAACPTAPIPTYNLTFQIDMSNSDCDGGYDSVTVAGAGARLTAFGSGLTMHEVGTSKIFELSVDSLDSGEVEFKFRYHKNGNTNWEGGNNRIFALAANDTIDLTCFGSRTVGACPTKPAPSTITFKVDMTNETPSQVYLIGTFQTPNWQAGALRMSPSPGQPGVFEVTVNNVCPGNFNYKFMNGDSSVSSNEENFPDSTNRGCVEPSGVGGFNRIYTRTAATPVTLYYVYNTCTVGSNVGIHEVSLNQTFKLYPNPAQSYTMIEFNDKSTTHNVVVMDIAGKVIQSYNDYSQNTLLINTDEMSKGIYFIKASNTRNESVTSKLIVR